MSHPSRLDHNGGCHGDPASLPRVDGASCVRSGAASTPRSLNELLDAARARKLPRSHSTRESRRETPHVRRELLLRMCAKPRTFTGSDSGFARMRPSLFQVDVLCQCERGREEGGVGRTESEGKAEVT